MRIKNKKTIYLVFFPIMIMFAIVSFFQSNNLALSQGDSMFPTFSGCTLLLINEKSTIGSIAIGDIIVVDISDLNAEYNEISHRLIENNVETQSFSTRGDNSNYYAYPSSIDGYFSYDKFKGKVTNYFNLPNWLCTPRAGD